MLQSLKEYDFLENSVFYGSDAILEHIRQIFPRAKLMASYRRGERLQERIRELTPYAFDVPWPLLTSELIESLHLQNIKIFSDAPHNATKEELQNAVHLGIDLIQTDRIFEVYEAERSGK